MPCRSDYMEPTGKEKRLQETAQLLQWVGKKLGFVISKDLAEATKDPYCRQDYVPELCKLLTNLPEAKRDQLVYNARDPMSRKLADWWEEHQRADAERRAIEEDKKRRAQREQRRPEWIKSALAKLTKDERWALGYDYLVD